jgi:formylglycine-generating enzyme required for sulfatase activity
MDRDTFNRLQALLGGLPGWDDDRKRRAFVNAALWGHPILGAFQHDGPPDALAGELAEACARHDAPTSDGLSPACALLDQIRRDGNATGARAAEVAELEGRLCAPPRTPEAADHRPRWCADPYPGLHALDHDQALIFFGREDETADLVRRLAEGSKLLLVTGASGSGKSSLVRAGLWAQVAAGTAPGIAAGERWRITAMTPAELGDDPLLALANSLTKGADGLHALVPREWAARLATDRDAFAELLDEALHNRPSEAEWLLVLDQLEELFTLVPQAHRKTFLDRLLEAAALPRFRVVATVRADFLPACGDHPGLNRVINQGHLYYVGQPDALALARMVMGPVTELALCERDPKGHERPIAMDLSRALVRRLVGDAAAAPGGLALLAFALADLYRRCRPDPSQETGRMDLAAYLSEDFGGLAGVLRRRADAALAALDREAREALPRVFSRLVAVREDGTPTRRRERRDHWAGDPPALRLIDRFSDAAGASTGRSRNRLLVTGTDAAPTVEVAHEALLTVWPTLADWIKDRARALHLRDRVQHEAQAWTAAGRPDHQRWHHELLAPARDLLAEADLLAETERDPDAADFLIPEPDWLLAELLCSNTDHARREDIGLRLAQIGDPRPGVGVVDGLPDILWRDIPGGEVDVEDPGRVRVEPFRIAACPVTHDQFCAFLEAADGFDSERWWQDLERQAAVSGTVRRHGNHPATLVSWYDAMAFCRWLSFRLGYPVRLPDEAEWQWAAQSARRGFEYPWGTQWREGLANTEGAGLGRTTAVGMYPSGCSDQGVCDQVGNVLEWCLNDYRRPKRKAPGGGVSRVLRGGSWYDHRTFARAGYRLANPPHFRGVNVGFRVVCVSPTPSVAEQLATDPLSTDPPHQRRRPASAGPSPREAA